MKERQEQPANGTAVSPEEDGSPKGVAENMREAGKALSLTVILGLAGLVVSIGFAVAYAFFLLFLAPYGMWTIPYSAASMFFKLFALLCFLAGAGYAFRKFPLGKIQKGMYWLMGGAVAIMIIATAVVTMSRD